MSFSILVIMGIGGSLFGHAESYGGTREKLRIADGTTPASALVYVALQKGYFEQEGLDVSCSFYPSGKTALEEVVSGKADLSTVGDMPIVLEVMKGAEISIIAGIADTEGLTAIVGRKDLNPGISTSDDLRDKIIGVTEGTGAQFFLDSFLLFNRIPRSTVRVVNVPPEAMVDALRTGEVQAVTTWPPVLFQLKKEFGENVVFFYDDRIYRMTWNMVGSRDFVYKNPQAVQKVLRALMKAEAFIRKRPGDGRLITARRLGTDPVQSELSWSFYRFRLSLDRALLLTLEDLTRWAIKNKLTEKKEVPNYLDHIHFGALESIKPDAVTIAH